MRKVAMKHFVLGIVILLGCVACSDGGGSTNAAGAYGFIDGPLPEESDLCSLRVGVSTKADAIRVLGEPTSVVESAFSASVEYWYGDPLAGAVDALHVLSLRFDEDELFSDVSVSNLPLPRCLREQLLRPDTQEDTK